jgi:hypothetical protein
MYLHLTDSGLMGENITPIKFEDGPYSGAVVGLDLQVLSCLLNDINHMCYFSFSDEVTKLIRPV